MDLQEQYQTGKDAEAFLGYVSEHPYFEKLLERVKLEFARRILDLSPTDKDSFSLYRASMTAIDEVMNAIRGDIYLGSEALDQINGKAPAPGGLL